MIKQCIIRNKKFTGHHFFHNWMASIFNINDTSLVKGRSYILICFRYKCKRGKNICPCDHTGCFLNSLHLRCQFFTNCHICFILQSIKFILCPKNCSCQFRQFFCRIPFGIRKSLTADIIIRHQVFIRIRYFYIIAKNFIKTHSQIFNSCLFPLSLF